MPTIETALTRKLGITHPILLAPMGSAAGGKLAAAVTNAGGLGLIGSGYADAGVAGGQKLTGDGGGVGIARADQAEAARVGDGSGELAAGRRTHRCQQDRMGDAERAGQRGLDRGHGRSL